MKKRKEELGHEYDEAIRLCLQADYQPLILGESKGYNKELVERAFTPGTWDTSHCNKSFEEFKHLIDKVIVEEQ